MQAYFYYGKSLLAMSKIESVVLSNALAGLDIDTPDTTEGSVEELKKCSKEEGDDVKLRVAEAWEENLKNHKLFATAHRYGANENGTDFEDEEETTEDKQSGPEPAWEGLEMVVNITNAYTKIIETSHGLMVLHAALHVSDIYLARELPPGTTP